MYKLDLCWKGGETARGVFFVRKGLAAFHFVRRRVQYTRQAATFFVGRRVPKRESNESASPYRNAENAKR